MGDYGLVLLDADETLFDFAKAERHALAQAFARFSLELTTAVFEDYVEINKALWLRLEKGEMDQSRLKTERFRLLFERLKLELDAAAFSSAYIESLAEASFLLEGAEDICAYLSSKYRLAIVTNGIKDVQAPRIGGSAIRRYISGIAISEEAGSSKPHTGIFDYTCQLLGFHDRKRMIIVGDSLSSDIQGGINYGIDTVWANLGSAANGTGIVPTFEIHALGELRDIL